MVTESCCGVVQAATGARRRADVRLGLVVNPIAGMGGRLAFKGSDDVALVAAARERGADPDRSGPRDRGTATAGASLDAGLEVLAYAGEMGEQEARDAQLAPTVVGTAPVVTSAQDTRAAAQAMADRGGRPAPVRRRRRDCRGRAARRSAIACPCSASRRA